MKNVYESPVSEVMEITASTFLCGSQLVPPGEVDGPPEQAPARRLTKLYI